MTNSVPNLLRLDELQQHPADLISRISLSTLLTLSRTPCVHCEIPAARLGAVGSVTDPSCAGEGQADLHLGRHMFVVAHKGSSLACDVFSAVVETESSMDELELIVASFALGSSCCE